MADGLTVRRLYIDSRFRSTGTTDDFEVQLQEGVQLPANCHCYMSEFTGVVSFETINESNRNLYIGEFVGGVASFRIVQLPLGAHDSESLRAAIQDAVNVGRATGVGTYTVTRSSSAGSTATASLGSAAYRYYTLTVSAGAFAIVPDDLLENLAWYASTWRGSGGAVYDTASPRSTNEIFAFSDTIQWQASHVSKFVDLRSKHSLYVHSSLGNNDSLGPNGLRSILGKVPIQGGYGTVAHYQHGGSPYENSHIGPTMLLRPRFYLRDARNQRVDLQGGHWSATIVFCIQ